MDDIERILVFYAQDRRLEGRATESTIRTALVTLRPFERWLAEHGVPRSGITHEVLTDYRYHLSTTSARHKRGALRRPGTVYRILDRVKQYCVWLRANGYLEGDPFARFALPRPPDRVIDPPTVDQVQAFMTAMRTMPMCALRRARNVVMLMLTLEGGLRIGVELLSLNRADVEAPDGIRDSVLICGKGGFHRRFPVSEPTQAALRDYLGLRADNNAALFVMLGRSKGHMGEYFRLEYP